MRIAPILAIMLLGTGCTTSPEQAARRDAAQAALVPAATPVGEPVSCVQTSRIRQTEIHGDGVIDFRMVDGRVFRNTLPQSCPGLGFEDRFGYRTSIGELCSVDTITVLRQNIPGPTCGLGQFQQVELQRN